MVWFLADLDFHKLLFVDHSLLQEEVGVKVKGHHGPVILLKVPLHLFTYHLGLELVLHSPLHPLDDPPDDQQAKKNMSGRFSGSSSPSHSLAVPVVGLLTSVLHQQ